MGFYSCWAIRVKSIDSRSLQDEQLHAINLRYTHENFMKLRKKKGFIFG